MRRQRGFTALEVAIVALVLGIVAAAGLPALSNLWSDSTLDGAANDLMWDLHYAQSMALKTQTIHGLMMWFDGASRNYELYQNNGYDAGVPIRITLTHPTTKRPYTVDWSTANSYRGAQIASTSFGSSPAWVEYDPQGAPTNGGAIVLQLGSRQRVLTIHAITGEVTLSTQ